MRRSEEMIRVKKIKNGEMMKWERKFGNIGEERSEKIRGEERRVEKKRRRW